MHSKSATIVDDPQSRRRKKKIRLRFSFNHWGGPGMTPYMLAGALGPRSIEITVKRGGATFDQGCLEVNPALGFIIPREFEKLFAGKCGQRLALLSAEHFAKGDIVGINPLDDSFYDRVGSGHRSRALAPGWPAASSLET